MLTFSVLYCSAPAMPSRICIF